VTPSGQTVTYGYSNRQLTSVSINGNALLTQVPYEPFGPVSGWTWANNTNEARVYDQDGNVTNVESAEGFTCSYDSAFRITGPIQCAPLSTNATPPPRSTPSSQYKVAASIWRSEQN
jgi:hypothetical protein